MKLPHSDYKNVVFEIFQLCLTFFVISKLPVRTCPNENFGISM